MSRSTLSRLSTAFTLLEVLVSSSILLGLLVLLFGVSEAGARFWGHSEQRRAPLREAGASLRLISRDLRSAVITADPSTLLIRHGTNGDDSLFFLVSHGADHRPEASVGDLCATGYFLAPSRDGVGERDLYRFHASGDPVMEALVSGKLPDLYATGLPGSTNTELLARHVASLNVRPVDSDSHNDQRTALSLKITTVDATTDRLLGSKTLDPAARASLIEGNGTLLGTVVALPPARHPNTRP
jgi:hypothetical protein